MAELRRADNQWRRTDEADRTPASSRVLRYIGTALLDPPPDASPVARLDAKQTRRAEPPGVSLLPFVPARAASPVRLLKQPEVSDMTANPKHDNPILVTGAAGAVGGVGRNLTDFLLARGQ